jgi:hypothetical protein
VVRDLRHHLRVDVKARTSGGVLVLTCAALGSPVSEVAQVVACDPRALRDSVKGSERLTTATAGAVARWIPCLWWRTLWRLGHPMGNDRDELAAVSRLALTLPWLPDDWSADIARASLWHEVRPEEHAPKSRAGGVNGRSKLTDRDAYEIRRMHRAGLSLRAIGRRFGVSASTVHACVTGATWR